jgi:non-ribosomal peptide synthetase component F
MEQPRRTGYIPAPDRSVLRRVRVAELEAARERPSAPFQMLFHVAETADGIELHATYDAASFPSDRAHHLFEQYQHLLAQIGEDATRPIDAYSLVTPAMQALLPDMKERLPETSYRPLTHLVAEWAERTPERVAVAQGSEQWSYRELVFQAAGIARALKGEEGSGLRQGDVVAVWGGRSFGLVASMLGVLASGGVLLLLDPQLSPARLAIMVEEARASHVISLAGEEPSPGWLAARDWRELRVDPARGIGPSAVAGEEPPRLAAPPPDAPRRALT